MRHVRPLVWHVVQKPELRYGVFYMQGSVTIRAYGASGWFISKVEGDLDANGKWWFPFMGLARWVGFRLDCLSAGTLLVGSVLAMLLRHKVIANPWHTGMCCADAVGQSIACYFCSESLLARTGAAPKHHLEVITV